MEKKKSKESRCYLEVGERTGCPHNLLADWSQKKEKKKHIYREEGNKNSTHEDRNVETNVKNFCTVADPFKPGRG